MFFLVKSQKGVQDIKIRRMAVAEGTSKIKREGKGGGA